MCDKRKAKKISLPTNKYIVNSGEDKFGSKKTELNSLKSQKKEYPTRKNPTITFKVIFTKELT
jgi:hypothetical protein